ncbi:GAF domain-containing protein [Streptomyces sp. NPDC058685]|uniref:GAF domain-containing sensor histidine kinase n=1 Tax=Streptomyces sp. NPDC058685 TaxID=3346598 RepID=UPI0036607968
MLLEAVLSVGTDLELHTTLQHIVDSAAGLTRAGHGALGVLDPESGTITELYTAGAAARTEGDEDCLSPEDGRAAPLPAGDDGLISAFMRDPRLLNPDGPDDPAGAPSPGAPGGRPGTYTYLRVPIRVHTQDFGLLCLTERRDGSFTEDDVALLRMLAAQAGIAIGNARLYESARQRERWIEGAAAVTTALLTGESAQDALKTVAEQARVLADASAGVVLQPTEDGGMEIVAASAADDPGDIVGTTIAPGSPVLVQLLGGEPVFIDDSATDPRMTTHVRSRFGPSMMLPLQSGGRLIGTLALPRRRHGPPYTAAERRLAIRFASHAALALVLADAQHNRRQLAVYEDRDRIARDLHDLVVQRLFATEMMLESTRRRAPGDESDELLGRAVDELDSTIQEVRTTIFALQQPPAEAPAGFRDRVLRETAGAAALLGFQPSVQFRGAVDALVREPADQQLLAALRGALAAAHRRPDVTAIDVEVDATVLLPDGRPGVRLVVADDGRPGEGGDGGGGGHREDGEDRGHGEDGEDRGQGTTVTWQAPR